jgi:N,N'-diacetyllegionaminate synthase
MRIGSLDTATHVIVVAEIGNNHEGDFAVAGQLIDRAAEAGADAVKFQTARADLFISPADADRRKRFASYEFTPDQWAQLSSQARRRGLLFMSTPLDLRSLEMLTPLVDALKIASGDITFAPLLDAAAATRKPMVISTGAADLDEAVAAVGRVRAHWARANHDGDLAVLHCVSAYPTPAAEAQLRTIQSLAERLDATIGYSDHVLGIEAAVAAVALGARVLEKHFTLDKNYSAFRDHQLSADPSDMRALVERVRVIEPMLGGGGKAIQPAERGNRPAIRRSIAAATDLAAGHVLRASDLIWIRPGTGLAPGQEHLVTGRSLVHGVSAGTLLSELDVK